MLTVAPIQRTLADTDFSLDVIQGKFTLIKQPTQQQKVGNYTTFFAFSTRIDEGSDSMSEKAGTKGKRKLHSHSKQIMVLKALPYGLSTHARLRPQVCLCLSSILSPQSAASAFSTPQPSCKYFKMQLLQMKERTKPSHVLIYKSVCNCRLKLFPFGG